MFATVYAFLPPQAGGTPLVNLHYKKIHVFQHTQHRILEEHAVPFCLEHDIKWFMHDNCLGWNAKSSHKFVSKLRNEYDINVFEHPSCSPDLNPIELVWGRVQHLLDTEYRPTNLHELMDGIERAWPRCTTPKVLAEIRAFTLKNMHSCLHSLGGQRYDVPH